MLELLGLTVMYKEGSKHRDLVRKLPQRLHQPEPFGTKAPKALSHGSLDSELDAMQEYTICICIHMDIHHMHATGPPLVMLVQIDSNAA